jgi:hypothetical protein
METESRDDDAKLFRRLDNLGPGRNLYLKIINYQVRHRLPLTFPERKNSPQSSQRSLRPQPKAKRVLATDSTIMMHKK